MADDRKIDRDIVRDNFIDRAIGERESISGRADNRLATPLGHLIRVSPR